MHVLLPFAVSPRDRVNLHARHHGIAANITLDGSPPEVGALQRAAQGKHKVSSVLCALCSNILYIMSPKTPA